MMERHTCATGEKRGIVVYANDNDYASLPQRARDDDRLIILFQVQNLEQLRASDKHPHYQEGTVLRWATSRDGGLTWAIHETCPRLGHIRDISYGSVPLKDGGTFTLTFDTARPLRAIIQHGVIGYRPYQALITLLAGAVAMSGMAQAIWLVVGAVGVASSLWAIIGTAYDECFAEASRLAKLMALVSAAAGLLTISGFIAAR